MDFSVLMQDLRDVAEKYKGKTTEPQVSTLAYVDMFTKVRDMISEILKRAQKVTDDYDDQITVLWVALNQLAAIYKDLSMGNARDNLSKFIFGLCAKTVLNIQWSQLDEDSKIKKNFVSAIESVHEILSGFGFTKFQLILDLMESHWTHPVLSAIMSSDDEDIEGGLEYIQEEDPDILKLRIEIMMKENCEEFALNLCHWSLKHPTLTNDLKIKEHQIFMLYKQGEYSKMQEVCESIVCHDGIKVMSHLAKVPSNQSLCIRLAQVFLIQDWVISNRKCCTQELLKLWIHHQYLADKDEERFLDSIWTVAKVCRDTEQIGVLIDGVRKECGDMFIQLYTDLCKYAVNIDKGNMEISQKDGDIEEVNTRRIRIAKTSVRIAFMLKEYDFRISRISGLTAFALDPSTENLNLVNKLYWTIKNTTATAANSRVNPATLYEVERLLGLMRPEMLNPDFSWKQLIPICKKYKGDFDRFGSTKVPGQVISSQSETVPGTSANITSGDVVDKTVKTEPEQIAKRRDSKKKSEQDIQRHHVERMLQSRNLSREQIEKILSEQFPRNALKDLSDGPPLSMKQLDKTIDDLKRSIYKETQYREALEKKFSTFSQAKKTAETKTQGHAHVSRHEQFQKSQPGIVYARQHSTPTILTGSHSTGFSRQLSQGSTVPPRAHSRQLSSPVGSVGGSPPPAHSPAGSISSPTFFQPQSHSMGRPQSASPNSAHTGHTHQLAGKGLSEAKSQYGSPTASQSSSTPASTASQLVRQMQNQAHTQVAQKPHCAISHPDMLRPADSSQQECAKIAQQIAEMHEWQRAEKERLERIRMQGRIDGVKAALNSRNVPNSNQISELLSMTIKGGKSVSLQEYQKQLTGSTPELNSDALKRKFERKVIGKQKNLNQQVKPSNSHAQNTATITSPQQDVQDKDKKMTTQKLYLTTDNVQLKRDSAGNVNLGSSKVSIKPVFSMVVPKSMTRPEKQKELVKTVTNMVKQVSGPTAAIRPKIWPQQNMPQSSAVSTATNLVASTGQSFSLGQASQNGTQYVDILPKQPAPVDNAASVSFLQPLLQGVSQSQLISTDSVLLPSVNLVQSQNALPVQTASVDPSYTFSGGDLQNLNTLATASLSVLEQTDNQAISGMQQVQQSLQQPVQQLFGSTMVNTQQMVTAEPQIVQPPGIVATPLFTGANTDLTQQPFSTVHQPFLSSGQVINAQQQMPLQPQPNITIQHTEIPQLLTMQSVPVPNFVQTLPPVQSFVGVDQSQLTGNIPAQMNPSSRDVNQMIASSRVTNLAQVYPEPQQQQQPHQQQQQQQETGGATPVPVTTPPRRVAPSSFLAAPELSPAVVQQILTSLKRTGALGKAAQSSPATNNQVSGANNEPSGQLQENEATVQDNMKQLLVNKDDPNFKKSVLEATQKIAQLRKQYNVLTSQGRLNSSPENSTMQPGFSKPGLLQRMMESDADLGTLLQHSATKPASGAMRAQTGMGKAVSTENQNIPDLPDLGASAIDSILGAVVETSTASKQEVVNKSHHIPHSQMSTFNNNNSMGKPVSGGMTLNSEQTALPHQQQTFGVKSVVGEVPPQNSSANVMDPTGERTVQSTYMNANRIAKEREGKYQSPASLSPRDIRGGAVPAENCSCMLYKEHLNAPLDKRLCNCSDTKILPQQIPNDQVMKTNETVACGICYKKFNTITALKDHVKKSCTNHSSAQKNVQLRDFEYSVTYKCTNCNFMNCNEKISTKHVEHCSSNVTSSPVKAQLITLYKCRMCSEMFSDKQTTYRHVSRLCPKLKVASTQKDVQDLYHKLKSANMIQTQSSEQDTSYKALKDQRVSVKDYLEQFNEIEDRKRVGRENLPVERNRENSTAIAEKDRSKGGELSIKEYVEKILGVGSLMDKGITKAEPKKVSNSEANVSKVETSVPISYKAEKNLRQKHDISDDNLKANHKKTRGRKSARCESKRKDDRRQKGLREKRLIKRQKFLIEEMGTRQKVKKKLDEYELKSSDSKKPDDFEESESDSKMGCPEDEESEDMPGSEHESCEADPSEHTKCLLCDHVNKDRYYRSYVKHYVQKHNMGCKKKEDGHYCRYCDMFYPGNSKRELSSHVLIKHKAHVYHLIVKKKFKGEKLSFVTKTKFLQDSGGRKTKASTVRAGTSTEKISKHLKALALRKRCAENLKKIASQRASMEKDTSEDDSETDKEENTEDCSRVVMNTRQTRNKKYVEHGDIDEVSTTRNDLKNDRLRNRSRSSSISSKSSRNEPSTVAKKLRSRSKGDENVEQDGIEDCKLMLTRSGKVIKKLETDSSYVTETSDDNEEYEGEDDTEDNSERQEVKKQGKMERRKSLRSKRWSGNSRQMDTSDESSDEEVTPRVTRSALKAGEVKKVHRHKGEDDGKAIEYVENLDGSKILELEDQRIIRHPQKDSENKSSLQNKSDNICSNESSSEAADIVKKSDGSSDIPKRNSNQIEISGTKDYHELEENEYNLDDISDTGSTKVEKVYSLRRRTAKNEEITDSDSQLNDSDKSTKMESLEKSCGKTKQLDETVKSEKETVKSEKETVKSEKLVNQRHSSAEQNFSKVKDLSVLVHPEEDFAGLDSPVVRDGFNSKDLESTSADDTTQDEVSAIVQPKAVIASDDEFVFLQNVQTIKSPVNSNQLKTNQPKAVIASDDEFAFLQNEQSVSALMNTKQNVKSSSKIDKAFDSEFLKFANSRTENEESSESMDSDNEIDENIEEQPLANETAEEDSKQLTDELNDDVPVLPPKNTFGSAFLKFAAASQPSKSNKDDVIKTTAHMESSSTSSKAKGFISAFEDFFANQPASPSTIDYPKRKSRLQKAVSDTNSEDTSDYDAYAMMDPAKMYSYYKTKFHLVECSVLLTRLDPTEKKVMEKIEKNVPKRKEPTDVIVIDSEVEDDTHIQSDKTACDLEDFRVDSSIEQIIKPHTVDSNEKENIADTNLCCAEEGGNGTSKSRTDAICVKENVAYRESAKNEFHESSADDIKIHSTDNAEIVSTIEYLLKSVCSDTEVQRSSETNLMDGTNNMETGIGENLSDQSKTIDAYKATQQVAKSNGGANLDTTIVMKQDMLVSKSYDHKERDQATNENKQVSSEMVVYEVAEDGQEVMEEGMTALPENNVISSLSKPDSTAATAPRTDNELQSEIKESGKISCLSISIECDPDREVNTSVPEIRLKSPSTRTEKNEEQLCISDNSTRNNEEFHLLESNINDENDGDEHVEAISFPRLEPNTQQDLSTCSVLGKQTKIETENEEDTNVNRSVEFETSKEYSPEVSEQASGQLDEETVEEPNALQDLSTCTVLDKQHERETKNVEDKNVSRFVEFETSKESSPEVSEQASGHLIEETAEEAKSDGTTSDNLKSNFSKIVSVDLDSDQVQINEVLEEICDAVQSNNGSETPGLEEMNEVSPLEKVVDIEVQGTIKTIEKNTQELDDVSTDVKMENDLQSPSEKEGNSESSEERNDNGDSIDTAPAPAIFSQSLVAPQTYDETYSDSDIEPIELGTIPCEKLLGEDECILNIDETTGVLEEVDGVCTVSSTEIVVGILGSFDSNDGENYEENHSLDEKDSESPCETEETDTIHNVHDNFEYEGKVSAEYAQQNLPDIRISENSLKTHDDESNILSNSSSKTLDSKSCFVQLSERQKKKPGSAEFASENEQELESVARNSEMSSGSLGEEPTEIIDKNNKQIISDMDTPTTQQFMNDEMTRASQTKDTASEERNEEVVANLSEGTVKVIDESNEQNMSDMDSQTTQQFMNDAITRGSQITDTASEKRNEEAVTNLSEGTVEIVDERNGLNISDIDTPTTQQFMNNEMTRASQTTDTASEARNEVLVNLSEGTVEIIDERNEQIISDNDTPTTQQFMNDEMTGALQASASEERNEEVTADIKELEVSKSTTGCKSKNAANNSVFLGSNKFTQTKTAKTESESTGTIEFKTKMLEQKSVLCLNQGTSEEFKIPIKDHMLTTGAESYENDQFISRDDSVSQSQKEVLNIDTTESKGMIDSDITEKDVPVLDKDLKTCDSDNLISRPDEDHPTSCVQNVEMVEKLEAIKVAEEEEPSDVRLDKNINGNTEENQNVIIPCAKDTSSSTSEHTMCLRIHEDSTSEIREKMEKVPDENQRSERDDTEQIVKAVLDEIIDLTLPVSKALTDTSDESMEDDNEKDKQCASETKDFPVNAKQNFVKEKFVKNDTALSEMSEVGKTEFEASEEEMVNEKSCSSEVSFELMQSSKEVNLHDLSISQNILDKPDRMQDGIEASVKKDLMVESKEDYERNNEETEVLSLIPNPNQGEVLMEEFQSSVESYKCINETSNEMVHEKMSCEVREAVHADVIEYFLCKESSVSEKSLSRNETDESNEQLSFIVESILEDILSEVAIECKAKEKEPVSEDRSCEKPDESVKSVMQSILNQLQSSMREESKSKMTLYFGDPERAMSDEKIITGAKTQDLGFEKPVKENSQSAHTTTPKIPTNVLSASVNESNDIQNALNSKIVGITQDPNERSVRHESVLSNSVSNKDDKVLKILKPGTTLQTPFIAATIDREHTEECGVGETEKTRKVVHVIHVQPKNASATSGSSTSIVCIKKHEKSERSTDVTSKKSRTFSLRDKPKKDYKELLAGRETISKKDSQLTGSDRTGDPSEETPPVAEQTCSDSSVEVKQTEQGNMIRSKTENGKLGKVSNEKQKHKVRRKSEESGIDTQRKSAKRKNESHSIVSNKKQKLDVGDVKLQKSSAKELRNKATTRRLAGTDPQNEDVSESILGENESLEEFQRRTENVKQAHKKSCKPYECDFNFEEDGIKSHSLKHNSTGTDLKHHKIDTSSTCKSYSCGGQSNDKKEELDKSESSTKCRLATSDNVGKDRSASNQTKQMSNLEETLPSMALKLVTSCSSSKPDPVDPIFSPHIFTCDNVKKYTRQLSGEKERTSKAARATAPVSVILSEKNHYNKKSLSQLISEKNKESEVTAQHKNVNDVKDHVAKDGAVSKVRAIKQFHKTDKPFEWESGSPVRETRSKGKDKQTDETRTERNVAAKKDNTVKSEASPVRDIRSRGRSSSSHDCKKVDNSLNTSKDTANSATKMVRGRKKSEPSSELIKSPEETSSSKEIKSRARNKSKSSKISTKSNQECADVNNVRNRRASGKNKPVEKVETHEHTEPPQDNENSAGGKKLKIPAKSVEDQKLAKDKSSIHSLVSAKREGSRGRETKPKGSDIQSKNAKERRQSEKSTKSLQSRSRSRSQDKSVIDKLGQKRREKSLSPSKSEKRKTVDSEKKANAALATKQIVRKQLKAKQESAATSKAKAQLGSKSGLKCQSSGKVTEVKKGTVKCKLDGTSSSPNSTPVKDGSAISECRYGHSVFQEDCSECFGNPVFLKGQKHVYESKRAHVRQVIHKGKVFEIQKGSVTETDIQKRKVSELKSHDESPTRSASNSTSKAAANSVPVSTVGLRTRSSANEESPTQSVSRKRKRSPESESMGDKKIITSSNINQYISETLKKIKIERENSTSHQKWIVQKKASLKGPKFPYSFKKS